MTVAASLAPAQVAAGSVVNGSFEDIVPGSFLGRNGSSYGNMPTSGNSWDVWQSVNGWSTVSGSGIEIQTQRTLGLAPADGDYYVELDSYSNSSMSQTLNLGVGRYMLSFWYSPRVGNALTDGIEYALGNLVSGLANDGVNGATRGGWTQILSSFTVTTAGAYNLLFSASGQSDSYGGLVDDIQIAPVPLPAAGLALMAGLGALGAVRRRRKAA